MTRGEGIVVYCSKGNVMFRVFWKVFSGDTSKHRKYALLYDDLCM